MIDRRDGYPPSFIPYEDDDILVVNKPAGLNTHSAAPFEGEGLYEWLRHREPAWGSLAIIHRLDKETSGLIVLSKSSAANRSLTAQFTSRSVAKSYLFLSRRPVPSGKAVVESTLVRLGAKYVSRPEHAGGQSALTHFRQLKSMNGLFLVEATPVTGRTHQIRVHAADAGFPIVGDELYGGEPFHRLCLHAHRIKFQHPTSGKPLSFEVPGDFDLPNATQRVASMIALSENNVYRLQHGAADGWPGCYVDRLGDYLLIHTEGDLTSSQLGRITAMAGGSTATGIYQRRLQRNLRGKTEADLSPHKIAGQEAPASFLVRENGVNFELRFGEGYSVGLFLDQRDNRRRVRARHVGPGFPLFHDKPSPQVLNAFAYTCGFSVCAAMAGATVVSVDLSRKYLDWGQRNFVHNNLDPAQHEFIAGDVMDWLGRLRRRRRLFDLVLLDPPTFSNSKKSGVFKADKNYADLIELALPTVKPGGVLFCSTNVAGMSASDWLREIEGAIRAGRRNILQQQYFPQPVDFPITRTEPAYLKTVWLRIS